MSKSLAFEKLIAKKVKIKIFKFKYSLTIAFLLDSCTNFDKSYSKTLRYKIRANISNI